jgi:hypothetical protein
VLLISGIFTFFLAMRLFAKVEGVERGGSEHHRNFPWNGFGQLVSPGKIEKCLG